MAEPGAPYTEVSSPSDLSAAVYAIRRHFRVSFGDSAGPVEGWVPCAVPLTFQVPASFPRITFRTSLPYWLLDWSSSRDLVRSATASKIRRRPWILGTPGPWAGACARARASDCLLGQGRPLSPTPGGSRGFRVRLKPGKPGFRNLRGLDSPSLAGGVHISSLGRAPVTPTPDAGG